MINFVSVVMTVFNSEKFLREAIDSVLRQTFKNFELIIVNDASTDNSLKIIQEKSSLDQRIKIINLKENLGMANALNIGINDSKADYVSRMDSDDIMYKNRIEEQVSYMDKHKDVDVLSCLGTYMGLNGNTFGVTSTEINNHESSSTLIKNNKPIGLLHPGTMFKKKIVQEIGGYRKKFWPAEDIDLWNRLALRGHIIYVQKKILMKYRIHNNSIITSQFLKSQLIYEWVKYNLVCRNLNRPEIEFSEFKNLQKKKNIFFKVNNLRKTFYKYFLRKQIYFYLNKKILSLIIAIFISILLRPYKFFTNIYKRIYQLL